MNLIEIEKVIQSENLTTSLEPATAETGIEQLFVALPNNEAGEDFLLELVYVPGLSQELESSQLLQFFVALPCEVLPQCKSATCELLSRLNVNLPLPSLGYHPTDDFLYFKYMSVVPEDDSIEAKTAIATMLVETTWLLAYQLNLFYPTIESVATGKKTLTEVIAD